MEWERTGGLPVQVVGSDPLLDGYAYVGGMVESATDPSGHTYSECDAAADDCGGDGNAFGPDAVGPGGDNVPRGPELVNPADPTVCDAACVDAKYGLPADLPPAALDDTGAIDSLDAGLDTANEVGQEAEQLHDEELQAQADENAARTASNLHAAETGEGEGQPSTTEPNGTDSGKGPGSGGNGNGTGNGNGNSTNGNPGEPGQPPTTSGENGGGNGSNGNGDPNQWAQPNANQTRVGHYDWPQYVGDYRSGSLPRVPQLNYRIFVGEPGFARPGGSGPIYMEFNVPTTALNQGGTPGWFWISTEGVDVPIDGLIVFP